MTMRKQLSDMPGIYKEAYESATLLPTEWLLQILIRRFDTVVLTTSIRNHIQPQNDGTDKIDLTVCFSFPVSVENQTTQQQQALLAQKVSIKTSEILEQHIQTLDGRDEQ